MDEIERRVRDLERRLGEVRSLVSDCVRELETEDGDLQYLFAERLGHLGTAALDDLRSITRDHHATWSTRFWAAWIAVSLGDRGESVQLLCGAVDRHDEWTLPAANQLARHAVSEAREPLERALDWVDPNDTSATINFVDALASVGGSPSLQTKRRLLANSPEWIQQAMSETWREHR